MTEVNNQIMVKNTGTKKGNNAYSKWILNKQDFLENLSMDDNVFSKIRRLKTKSGNTLFDKIGFLNRSKEK